MNFMNVNRKCMHAKLKNAWSSSEHGMMTEISTFEDGMKYNGQVAGQTNDTFTDFRARATFKLKK